MSKLKKVLLMCTAYVLVAALAIGGTIAYLQDDDSDVNVMTLGNVSIAQHEYERVVENGEYKKDTINGTESYVLKDFTQGKPLLPATELDANGNPYNFGAGNYDSTRVKMSQVGSHGSMDVFTSKNAQDKFVTVENTGKSDAYVRTVIAFEIGSLDAGRFPAVIRRSSFMSDQGVWEVNDIGIVEIDGNNYYVSEYIYEGAKSLGGVHENGVLPAGDTTYPSLCQVYMTASATNEDCEKIDGNNNGTYDILVVSQAVQVAGFADAKTALNTAFGKSSEKAAEWFGGMGKVQFVEAEEQKAQIDGEVAEEILKDLEAGNDLIVDEKTDILMFDTDAVDAKGATVTLNGTGSDAYGYLAFLPEAGKNVTVENLNVTGSGFVEIGHYGMGGGDYVVNNLKIENLESTLANGDKGFVLGCGFAHYGNAVLNDCVMTGTTAKDGVMPVDLGCVNSTTTTINGGEYGTVYCWSHAVVTVNGAEIDTLQAAPIKGTVTIKAGSHVGTINVVYGNLSTYATAANLAKIVVEDGATVDAIVYNGTTYTVAEWNAYVASL